MGFYVELPQDKPAAVTALGFDPLAFFRTAVEARRHLEERYARVPAHIEANAHADSKPNAIAADLLLIGVMIGKGQVTVE